MRSRLLTIHKGFANISQSRKLATKPTRCQPHMNELPVPCGPWDPWYRQKQSFYMKHLLCGLACPVTLAINFGYIRFCYSKSDRTNLTPITPIWRKMKAILLSFCVQKWLFSLGMAIYTESIYLNFSPPAFPSPPSDLVEECDDSDS